MCGIVGKVNFGGTVDLAVIHRMCEAMVHRGPDSRGVWSADGVAIGMQRLAIIDVRGGDQPIFNEDGTVAVVMNGEIYNFERLRSDLIERGHVFATRSDTEVVVHLYEEYGEHLVDHLRGMFAFAVWDTGKRQLLLARDRVGKKPLFVVRSGDKLWFASEIMAMLQDPEIARIPDNRAIASYLALQYVPHPLTAFAGVQKLAPASTLLVSADSARERHYWDLNYTDVEPSSSEDELAEQLRQLLWESTRVRLMTEVPLGAFLSGGIDSSAVVAAMADQAAEPVKTFSIGFPEAEFDELRFARIVAQRFGTNHHEFVVEPRAIEIMPELARHYGEPFADCSAIPSFYLARITSRHVTVALNGDGGDESFAGYGRYIGRRMIDHLGHLPLCVRRLAPTLLEPLGRNGLGNNAADRAGRLARVLALDPPERYAHAMSIFPSLLCRDMMQPDFVDSTRGWDPDATIAEMWRRAPAQTDVDRMLYTDVNTYLPGDLLVKMDVATMASSLEARSPFLDHHLMEFAARLPARLKLQGKSGKLLLKKALRGIVPDEILDRPKMGFGVPLPDWFRRELRELPGDVLLARDARVHAYVKPAAISRMLEEHQLGRADHSRRLWALLQLEFWHREVVESPLLDPAGREPVALS